MVESVCSAGDPGLIAGGKDSPGGGHSNPLWYSCLENRLDRGAWRAMIHRVAKSGTQVKRLSMRARNGFWPRKDTMKGVKSQTRSMKMFVTHIAGEFTLRLHEGFLKLIGKGRKLNFKMSKTLE